MFRPNRLRRIIQTVGEPGRRFVFAFALWMALQGLSLLAPGEAFARVPTYRIANEMGLNENLVGLTMVVNAAALLWGMGDRPPHVRASIAFATGILWVFWAALQFLSGLQAGIYSGAAVWTVACSYMLLRAAQPFSALHGGRE